MSWFGGHFIKGYHLAGMLENSLPETHVRSINSFPIFNMGIRIFITIFNGENQALLQNKHKIYAYSSSVSMATAPL